MIREKGFFFKLLGAWILVFVLFVSVACAKEETEQYEDYFVIDTSQINTQVLIGQEIGLPVTVTNLGEPVEDPLYGVTITENGKDVTADVYDSAKNSAIFEKAGFYTVRFVMEDVDGNAVKDGKGNEFSAAVEIEATELMIEGAESPAVTVENEGNLRITFGQAVADGDSVGQYSLKGVNLSGNFDIRFKVKDLSFKTDSAAKMFIGFVRNTLQEEEDSISIGAKDKRFHAYIANVTEAEGWCAGGSNFIDSENAVTDTAGVHDIKIERRIEDAEATWYIYYDGELFSELSVGTEYSYLIRRVYFTAHLCGGTVFDIDFTGYPGGEAITRPDTDIFDLDKTTGVARTSMSYYVYADVYDESRRDLLDTAQISFMLDGQDVTEQVYDAEEKLFCADHEGIYQMIVRAGEGGIVYESIKQIEVWDKQASMYSYGEIDTEFGEDFDHIAVGREGALSFIDMQGMTTPKINYLTYVKENWDIEFTAKDLYSAKSDTEAPFAQVAFTLILAKNDDPGSIYFDDIFLEGKPNNDVWGYSSNIVGAAFIRYAWASCGIDMEATDEFDPNENRGVAIANDYMGEHSYKISCRTDEEGVVTYYYYFDGVLWAKHDTSVFLGVPITTHNDLSTLVGFQIKSQYMEGAITSLKITQAEPGIPDDGPEPSVPTETDVFDLSEMTPVAQAGLGHAVYYGAKEPQYEAAAAAAEVKFKLNGNDVTEEVYDASAKIFRPVTTGTYTMEVCHETDTETFRSVKTVEVVNAGGAYLFDSTDTAFGGLDKATVTKTGVDFRGMGEEDKSAKFTIDCNLRENWEISFKTNDMSSTRTNTVAPFGTLAMTLIIGNNNGDGLVFDDIKLECNPGDDCWGFASSMAGSDPVTYAWATWGIGTQTAEYKPSPEYQYSSMSYLTEHTYRIVCNTETDGTVVYSFYIDGVLWAVHDTSSQYGNEITAHNYYSTLYGVQFCSQYMNASVYDIEIKGLNE